VLRAILIDDESLALDFLELQINKLDGIEVIGKYTFFRVEEHTKLLQDIDLVFLDIEMPEVNGLELAELISEVNEDIEIIFVTAFNEYAVQAFELNALDYLLKPVRLERLKNTYERIEKRRSTSPKKASPTNEVMIKLGGEPGFYTNNERQHVTWRTTKTRELFLYLLHHRGQTIRKDFLTDYFWSNLDVERANAQMYTAIYHVRRTLRPMKEHIRIESNQEGYILVLENVTLDLYEWEKSLDNMPALTTSTVDIYEKVVKSYPGPYLGNTAYLWAEAECYRLEERWLDKAYKLADYYLEKNQNRKAKDWYTAITETREEEEKAHFQLMKLYAEEDYKQMVNAHYEQLVQIYKELNLPLNPEVETWYENWRG
jgi:two-component SAPR family response regulator